MGEMLWDFIQGREIQTKTDVKEEPALFKSGVFVVPKTH